MRLQTRVWRMFIRNITVMNKMILTVRGRSVTYHLHSITSTPNPPVMLFRNITVMNKMILTVRGRSVTYHLHSITSTPHPPVMLFRNITVMNKIEIDREGKSVNEPLTLFYKHPSSVCDVI